MWQISANKVDWMYDVDGISIVGTEATKGKLSVSYGTSLSTIYVRACPFGDPLGEKVSEPVEIHIIDPTPSTVTGVTISPATATISPNNPLQFTATVSGTGDFSHDVEWYVRNGYDLDSWTSWYKPGISTNNGITCLISSSGLLTFSSIYPLATANLKKIEVKAVSLEDPSQYAVASISNSDYEVNPNVIISPSDNVSVKKGDSLQFSITFAGMNYPNEWFEWSISTDQSNWLEYLEDGSSISQDGLLRIHTTTDTKTIYVKAEAASGDIHTVAVNIIDPFPATPVTSVTVSPSKITLKQGDRYRFSATVNGAGGGDFISQAVTWEVSGRISSSSSFLSPRITNLIDVLGVSISSSGVLQILPGCRFSQILVKAISVQDPRVYGTATVTVSDPGTIKDLFITPDFSSGKTGVTVNKGENSQLNAIATSTNNAKASIKWYISPGMPLQETSTRSVSLRRADTGSDIIWTKSFEKISIDDNGLLTIDPSTVVEEVYVRAEDEYDMNVNSVIKIVILEYYNANSNHVIEVRLPLVYAAGSDIYIDLPDAARVDIYRIDGALVRSVNAPEGKSVVASSLPRGIYVVRSGIATSKLIIR